MLKEKDLALIQKKLENGERFHLTPLKVSESKNTGKKLKIKNKDIVVMTRQLSIF